MSMLNRFIGKLLYPRTFKFTNNLKDAFLETVKETSQFDASIRDLSQTWLAVCPHTYFSELFLESENINHPVGGKFLFLLVSDTDCGYRFLFDTDVIFVHGDDIAKFFICSYLQKL